MEFPRLVESAVATRGLRSVVVHFTVKTICRQLWGSSSAWVQTGKLCGGDHVGLEWMNEKGQRGAWDQAESVAERANITELKKKDACGIYMVGVLDANSFHFSTCL